VKIFKLDSTQVSQVASGKPTNLNPDNVVLNGVISFQCRTHQVTAQDLGDGIVDVRVTEATEGSSGPY
jgi:hypothetical protein